MKHWTMRRVAGLTTASVALLFCLWQIVAMPEVAAQAAPVSQAPAASAPPQVDEFDRVAMLWYRQRLAKSGTARGEEIFFMSCWICHNEYTIATTKVHAPSLKDLFASSGQDISDDALMGIVRRGGLRMPAYPQRLLSDQDLRDLVAFLRARCATSKGSCFDETNPPANPRYKAQ